MKTPEQIKEWLEKQKWYESFKQQAEKNLGITPELDETLNGIDGILTISAAFDWQRSEEGFSFWERINKDFLRWYNKVI